MLSQVALLHDIVIVTSLKNKELSEYVLVFASNVQFYLLFEDYLVIPIFHASIYRSCVISGICVHVALDSTHPTAST